MTTPFANKPAPLVIDLMSISKGRATVLRGAPVRENLPTGTSLTDLGTIYDFSKAFGAVYYAVVWSTGDLTTATSTQIILRDYTNGANLLTLTSNASAATGTGGIASAYASWSTIANKPTTAARIGFECQNNDGVTREFGFFDAKLYVIQ